jgi:hypothetical protein
MFQELGSGIKALIERFIETPYFFYSEQDMHAYLYGISALIPLVLVDLAQNHFDV